MCIDEGDFSNAIWFWHKNFIFRCLYSYKTCLKHDIISLWSHNWRHFLLPLEVVFRWFDEISRKHCKENVWKVHSREPRQSCVQNSTQLQNFVLTWENIYGDIYIQYDGINRKCQDYRLTSGINISFPRCDLIK